MSATVERAAENQGYLWLESASADARIGADVRPQAGEFDQPAVHVRIDGTVRDAEEAAEFPLSEAQLLSSEVEDLLQV